MVLPYSGLLVLDFSRVLAGPFCTSLLADLGARVIKVERPGTGDDSRAFGPFVEADSLYFARVNRGKESLAADLVDDRELLLRIAATADVVVENFRPGVMARAGLAYGEVSRVNPDVVYASISGYGQTGPLAASPAYDAVVQGASGLVSITGMPGGPRVKPGVPVADLSAGLYAFGAIGAALYARDRGAGGAHLDLAMFDATVSMLEGGALAYLSSGRAPEPVGNAHFSIAPFDSFACADAEIVICCANDALYGALCAVLARPDLLADPRFVSNRARHRHRDELKAAMLATLAGRSAADWLALLGAAGVPCGPINDVAAALESEQARHRNLVVRAGDLRVPGTAIKSPQWDDPSVRPPAPALDADGPTIRREFA